MLVAVAAPAQLLTDNGAMLHVTTGAQLSVNGAILVQGAGWIDNAGMIDVSGDLLNNSMGTVFTATPGSVIMDGTVQVIGGSAPSFFNALDLQCNSLTLQQDIRTGGTQALANGVLQLRNAIVQLNGHRLTVINTSPTALTRTTGQLVSESGPLAGYGEVAWRTDNGTGSYVLPFGTGSVYLPVTLNITTGATAGWDLVVATYPTDPSASPNNRPLPNGLPSLTDLAGNENASNVVDRFWPMVSSSSGAPPIATLTFTYQDAEWNTGTNLILESTLQAQHFDGALWSQPPNGTANVVQNTVTTAPTSSFDMVWALTQGFAALPVELLLFDARREGSEVACSWLTATEEGNDHFVVERSADGTRFSDIGEVDGAGVSQTPVEYGFTDRSPEPGLNYYRLRQVDVDGTATWSDAVAVWMDGPANELTVFPNPCTDHLFVAGVPGTYATVLDATGRLVLDLGPVDGGPLDIASLPAGSYFLQVTGASGRRSALFVKG